MMQGMGKRLFVCLFVLVISACHAKTTPEVKITTTPVSFLQWAAAVQASSEFGMPDWSAARMRGSPDVEACADDSRAWASARGNGVEWVQLTYPKPVHATGVRVYQTFGRGAITRVSFVDTQGTVHVVWEGTDARSPCPGILAVTVPQTDYRVSGVRIDLDESRTGFWNEIDAVALVGLP